jgi:hypothetical protein
VFSGSRDAVLEFDTTALSWVPVEDDDGREFSRLKDKKADFVAIQLPDGYEGYEDCGI